MQGYEVQDILTEGQTSEEDADCDWGNTAIVTGIPCCDVKTCLTSTGGEGCLVLPCFTKRVGPLPAEAVMGGATLGERFLGPRDDVTAPYWVKVEPPFSDTLSL